MNDIKRFQVDGLWADLAVSRALCDMQVCRGKEPWAKQWDV